jgi:hypothetical protein
MATSHSNHLIRRPEQIAEDRAQKSREFLEAVLREIGEIAESKFNPSRPMEKLRATVPDAKRQIVSAQADISEELSRHGWHLHRVFIESGGRNEFFATVEFSAAESDIPTDGGTP